MYGALVAAAVLSCAGAMADMARDHKSAVVATLDKYDATAFLNEFAKRVGPPPFEIMPSGILIFEKADGNRAIQFFDEDGCISFGADASPPFVAGVMDAMGVRA